MRGALLSAVLLLAGCASMDKNECVSANWYAIGLEDGAQGRGVDRLGAHRRACAEHKVSPDGERYAAGHREGLRSFCTYERGYALGRSGKSTTTTCPPELRLVFLAGYSRGLEFHDLQRRLNQVNLDIRKTKASLAEPGVSPRRRTRTISKAGASPPGPYRRVSRRTPSARSCRSTIS